MGRGGEERALPSKGGVGPCEQPPCVFGPQARKALTERQRDLEMKTQQLEIKLSNKTEEDIKKARRKSTQAGERAPRPPLRASPALALAAQKGVSRELPPTGPGWGGGRDTGARSTSREPTSQGANPEGSSTGRSRFLPQNRVPELVP